MLRDREIFYEISKRTGVNPNVIEIVMGTYYEVLKECIENQVAVKIGELGKFTCTVRKPIKNLMCNNFGDEVIYVDAKGYIAPHFKISRKWKRELQEKTGFDEMEELEEKED